MQQDRGGGSDQDMKQNQQQDRRLKPLTGENQQPQPHQQQQQHPPQKCPRCESLNTKFCYYNNYSLSQPRYFCKTCRRYWTQGGTLRNVPVGGGCKKGKRTKISSSGEYSRSQAISIPDQQQTAQQQNLTSTQNLISSNPMISSTLRTKESGSLVSSSAITSVGSYYPGGGFLSSLAAIQSMNQPQSFNQPLNQGLSIGVCGDLGGSSNLGLLQGYGVPSFGSQQHQPIQQIQLFEMGNRDQKTVNMYSSDQEGLIQSGRPASGNSNSQQNWHHQSFINTSNPTVSEAVLWSINNNSSTGAASNSNTSNPPGASLSPNQWPDLPGYGAPP
ncbi:hypothetical protein REPUB_Repub13aG0242800 [Reevesia pubescens]